MQKLKMQNSHTKKKSSTDGVTLKLYNAVAKPMKDIRLDQVLLPSMQTMYPMPQIVQLWTPSSKIQYVNTIYGEVPKGSVLSYQLSSIPSADASSDIITVAGHKSPSFTPPGLLCRFYGPLPYRETCLFDSLFLDADQCVEIEKVTRRQSSSQEWHDLRQHRLTASVFKRVCSRRGNYESLASQLFSQKHIQTKEMKHGVDTEPVAAEKYAKAFGRNVYLSGLITNPNLIHLGASPDRWVFDPDCEQSQGLLEIKCPCVESVVHCAYLKQGNDGNLCLKENHDYFFQIMGQLGLSGSPWCDFFVYTNNDFHCERIYFDQPKFNTMLEKLDTFFFNYYLPYMAKQN